MGEHIILNHQRMLHLSGEPNELPTSSGSLCQRYCGAERISPAWFRTEPKEDGSGRQNWDAKGCTSTSLSSGGWWWTSQSVRPCKRDETSHIRTPRPVDRNHPRSLARCDPISYQDSLRGIRQITMRASSKSNWRTLLDTSEEERQAKARGHTPRKTRFSGKEYLWLYLRQFNMMTITHAVPYRKLPYILWTILQEMPSTYCPICLLILLMIRSYIVIQEISRPRRVHRLSGNVWVCSEDPEDFQCEPSHEPISGSQNHF